MLNRKGKLIPPTRVCLTIATDQLLASRCRQCVTLIQHFVFSSLDDDNGSLTRPQTVLSSVYSMQGITFKGCFSINIKDVYRNI